MAVSTWGPQQVYSTGFTNTRALLQNGPSTSDQGIPLGTYVDDGLKRHRWCQFNASVIRRGAVLYQSAATMRGVTDSGGNALAIYTSAVAPFGGKGNDVIKLYSAASFMSQLDKRFRAGTFTIVCGGGKGCSYGIKDYEVGVASGANKIWLDTPLYESLTLSTQARLQYNQYYGLIGLSLTTSSPAGLRGIATFSATASGYGWIQTRGVGLAIGSHVVFTPGELVFTGEAGAGPAGGVIPGQTGIIAASGNQGNFIPIGRAMSTSANHGFVILEITIE